MAKNTLIIISFFYSALIGGDCTDTSACNYNSSGMPSGVYFIKYHLGDYHSMQKVLLLK